jgi:hypothetical protein
MYGGNPNQIRITSQKGTLRDAFGDSAGVGEREIKVLSRGTAEEVEKIILNIFCLHGRVNEEDCCGTIPLLCGAVDSTPY